MGLVPVGCRGSPSTHWPPLERSCRMRILSSPSAPRPALAAMPGRWAGDTRLCPPGSVPAFGTRLSDRDGESRSDLPAPEPPQDTRTRPQQERSLNRQTDGWRSRLLHPSPSPPQAEGLGGAPCTPLQPPCPCGDRAAAAASPALRKGGQRRWVTRRGGLGPGRPLQQRGGGRWAPRVRAAAPEQVHPAGLGVCNLPDPPCTHRSPPRATPSEMLTGRSSRLRPPGVGGHGSGQAAWK